MATVVTSPGRCILGTRKTVKAKQTRGREHGRITESQKNGGRAFCTLFVLIDARSWVWAVHRIIVVIFRYVFHNWAHLWQNLNSPSANRAHGHWLLRSRSSKAPARCRSENWTTVCAFHDSVIIIHHIEGPISCRQNGAGYSTCTTWWVVLLCMARLQSTSWTFILSARFFLAWPWIYTLTVPSLTFWHQIPFICSVIVK